MKRRRLGKTGLMVGEIGAGCWTIGGPFANLGFGGGWDGVVDEDSKEGLITAINMGANLFDTADVYGFGHSERLIGWMLEKIRKELNISREDVVICSKVGYFRGTARHGFDPLHMRHQLEMSLQNLKTGYLDVYFFHHLDFGPNDEYLDGSVEEMRKFRKEGLVHFIGLRGPHKFSPNRLRGTDSREGTYERFTELADIIDPDVMSVRYNMISPTYDSAGSDIFEWAKQRDIGILIYKPLGQGLLLDKYDPKNPPRFTPEDNRKRKAWFREEGLTILRSRLAQLKEMFHCKTTAELAQLAIKYCLSRSESACVLVGFRNPNQVRETFSTNGYLTPEEMDCIRSVFKGINEEIGKFIDPGDDN